MIIKDTLLSNDLFGDLNPKDWPISIDDLPPGSALVGGSVRDGLLNRLSQKPDLDFVIPVNAIEFSKNLSNKISATFIKLDEKEFIHIFNQSVFSNYLKNDIWENANNISITIMENVNSFNNNEWNEMVKFEKETFVEESKELKEKSAGAGLTDND